MNPHSLKQELSSHLNLRERLREAFPEAEDGDLQDSLEGMTNLPEMLSEVLRSLLADEDFVGALRLRIGDMQARSSRLAERAKKKRELVSQVMADAEIKKLVQPDFTVSLRAGRAPLVVVDDLLASRKTDARASLAALVGSVFGAVEAVEDSGQFFTWYAAARITYG